jgi:hypothetical protein
MGTFAMRWSCYGGIAAFLSISCGCVVVNPKGDVKMSALPESFAFWKHSSSSGKMPYASTLRRVVDQQDKVVKKLQRQDWTGLVNETNTWTDDIRTLSGYANTTPDPNRFRIYCDQLLAQTQAIRDGALHQDPIACNNAVRGCDPVLNRMASDFPTEGPVMVASPASPAPPPGSPTRSQVHVQVGAP